jgi:hypothetical protein
MLAFVYRESNDKVVITSLDGEANTQALDLSGAPFENPYDIRKILVTLPSNAGIIVDAEFDKDNVHMIDLKSFMVSGEEGTVKEKAKDPQFLDTLTTVGNAVIQGFMNEPRILH